MARGYNYPVVVSTPYTVEIDETYTYAGKQGRVSSRATQNVVNGSAAESFTESWVWNDLGDETSVPGYASSGVRIKPGSANLRR